jgi:pimeloyl-CoA synthetase
MKKIRNIKDLEQEKLKLQVRQLELEKQLDHSWREIRKDLSRNNVTEQNQPGTVFNSKTNNALLNGALNVGAIFLSVIAGRTVGNAAEQIVGRLGQKINSMVSKRATP